MKKVTIILFAGILFLPFLFQSIFDLTGKHLDFALLGYADTYEKPKLTVETYINGEYQQSFESWFNENFIPRGFFIKTYDQIQYSAFALSNRVIGKNQNVFEEEYILDVIKDTTKDYSDVAMAEAMEEYVHQLEVIDTKLKEIDKHLLVYTTPSKAVYSYEDIPYRYRVRENEDGLRGIDLFRNLINKTEVTYLDSEEILKDSKEYPKFYTTGIHWSCPAEQEMTAAIFDMLSQKSGKKLRTFDLGEIETNNTGFYRDTDVFDLLNLYEDHDPITYYQYNMVKQFPDYYDEFSALVQGGSFAEGLTRFLYKSDEVWQFFIVHVFMGRMTIQQ